MKKSLLIVLLVILCLTLTGCGGGMISAPEGAIPFDQMPPIPEGLEEVTRSGTYSHPASNITVIEDSSSRTIIEYAKAPGCVEIFAEGLKEENVVEFASQYTEGLVSGGFRASPFTFFGNDALTIEGILDKDVKYAKAGDAAIYYYLPYEDYLIILRAHCKPEDMGETAGMLGFMAENYRANGVVAVE